MSAYHKELLHALNRSVCHVSIEHLSKMELLASCQIIEYTEEPNTVFVSIDRKATNLCFDAKFGAKSAKHALRIST